MYQEIVTTFRSRCQVFSTELFPPSCYCAVHEESVFQFGRKNLIVTLWRRMLPQIQCQLLLCQTSPCLSPHQVQKQKQEQKQNEHSPISLLLYWPGLLPCRKDTRWRQVLHPHSSAIRPYWGGPRTEEARDAYNLASAPWALLKQSTIMLMTWLFEGILFICARVVSFAARAQMTLRGRK